MLQLVAPLIWSEDGTNRVTTRQTHIEQAMSFGSYLSISLKRRSTWMAIFKDFRGFKGPIYTLGFLLITSGLLVIGCSKRSAALVESAPAYQPTPPPAQISLPKVVAPKLPEVQEAVKRVFKDGAFVDENARPSFFTGDFNGDASQDIAVVLKVAPGKLSQMNEEYPAWLLRDPFAKERAQLSVEESELLLAIIHGVGDNDWRDSQATQTYLLKNAVGNNVTVQTSEEFIKSRTSRRVPPVQGDLIAENLRGTSGYLYYTTGNYLWYDPKTFKPITTAQMIHGR